MALTDGHRTTGQPGRRPDWRRRRTRGWLVLAVWCVALGLVVVAGARFGEITGRHRSEQVDRMWTLAEVADDGSADITEVVDYDFGAGDRHGISRIVPGLSPDAPIAVASDSAPDDLVVTTEAEGTNLRIG